MNGQSFQMINLSVDDLSKLITECISKEMQGIKNLDTSKDIKLEKELLSIEEVSNLLGLSTTTLWKYRKDGTLPADKIGSRVYYSRTELLNHLNRAA